MEGCPGEIVRDDPAPMVVLESCVLVSSCLLGMTNPQSLSSHFPQLAWALQSGGVGLVSDPGLASEWTRPPVPCAMAPPAGTQAWLGSTGLLLLTLSHVLLTNFSGFPWLRTKA